MKKLFYSHQCIEQDDIDSVLEVLKSEFLTQGPKVREFEDLLASYCGSKYAVVLSSGTASLHAAYFAAGLSKDDEIITSPMTFLATANAALFLGSKPVFVDIEPDTGNIDAELIEEAITEKTKVIVPIHFGGHPAELNKISEIAQKHNVLVIEDACHALGSEYLGTKIGNCKYSDMVVFSFHPVKSITTGEGGAVLTNDDEFYSRLAMFRQHGVTKNPGLLQGNPDINGAWYYEMQYLGNNYRLTDIHSALGVSQLKKLDRFIQRRREIAETYNQIFKDNEFFDVPVERDYAKSAWHLYPIRLKDEFKCNKAQIFAELQGKGLGVQVHYIPVHIQPYYQQLGYKKGAYPNAEDFYQREISIPIYQTMSDDDVQYVRDNLFNVLGRYDVSA